MRNQSDRQPSCNYSVNYRSRMLIVVLILLSSTQAYPQVTSTCLNDELQLFNLALLNNGLFLIPPLLWNVVFASKLPEMYSEGSVPGPLLVTENILRFAAMMYPVFIPIDVDNNLFQAGLITYSVGTVLYFTSWSIMMFSKNEKVKNLPLVKLAPAYTPLVWLLGIGMMSDSALYPFLSTAFIGTHVGEYLFRFNVLTIKY